MLVPKTIIKYFPFFKVRKHGRPWIFLDSAASTQKPDSVIKSLTKVYETTYANIHRGIYDIAENATFLFEDTRKTIARFINAGEPAEIIFTKNTTEGINLLSYTLRSILKPGDEILLSEMEHHANMVPWQQAALASGAKLKFIPIKNDYRLQISGLNKLIGARTKIVSITAMSNVLGTVNDVKAIAKLAHAVGALMIVDAAQFAAHEEIDVQKLNCDFLVFSSHKIFGPSGVGVLYGKRKLLEDMPPFLTGGHMIDDVSWRQSTWNQIPAKFEAGTAAIAEVIAFGAAIKFINKIGWKKIKNYEKSLTKYTLAQLLKIRGLKLFGPKDAADRGPVFSFTLKGVHAHDVAGILNEYNIAIRAGHHCTAPLHKKLGIAATARASLAIYNTKEDVDKLVEGLVRVKKVMK